MKPYQAMKRWIPVCAALVIVAVFDGVLAWSRFWNVAPPAAPAVPPIFAKDAARPQQSSPSRTPVIGVIFANGPGLHAVSSTEDEDYSYFSISLNSNGEMLLEGPNGERLGFDPEAHKLMNQIQNGYYGEGDQIDDDDDDQPPQAHPTPAPTPTPPATLSGLDDNGFRQVEMGQIAPGKYRLKVITRQDADYTLEIRYRNRAGNLSTAYFTKVAVTPGDVHLYELEIPQDPTGEIKASRR